MEHPGVAAVLNNLAEPYHAQGRYTEAEPLYEQALAINEKVLGAEHPDVATNLSNLAAFYHDLGRDAEAEPLYERALAISERALGPDHPDVGVILENYSAFLRATDRANEAVAEELEARAANIRAKPAATKNATAEKAADRPRTASGDTYDGP